MEASQAGLAGGDGAAQQGDGGDGQQGEQAGAGPDLGALTQQLEGLNGSHEQMREALAPIADWVAQQQQAGGEGEGDGEQPLDLSELGPEFAAMPDDEQQQFAQGLQAIISQGIERGMEQRLAPMQQQMADFRMEWGARDVASELPQLQDGEYAKEVVGFAGQLAESLGQPELANNPQLWRLAHYALQGQQAANAENGAETPQTARLEGGGGAAPAGGQVDLGDEILKAGGGGRSVLPFG